MTVASAPGKIILFGEHAVVYGRPAIAVPVRQVQATAEVVTLSDAPPGEVHIEAPDVRFSAWLRETPPNHPLRLLLRLCLEELHLKEFPALQLKVTSTIPVAAGLGSGAAVSVAITRAIGQHFGRPIPVGRQSALAFEVERLYHGTPSGIDNTVIAFERPVRYVRGQALATFEIGEPFHLVIADSGQPSPTADAVGRVRQQWERQPERYEALFDAIGQTAESACRAIQDGRVADLGPLMDHNQALLEAMRLTTPLLHKLIDVARELGAQGAKLSGAGLGGNMIALAMPDGIAAIETALRAAGAVRTLHTEVRG
jgi:mevalonate kinase